MAFFDTAPQNSFFDSSSSFSQPSFSQPSFSQPSFSQPSFNQPSSSFFDSSSSFNPAAQHPTQHPTQQSSQDASFFETSSNPTFQNDASALKQSLSLNVNQYLNNINRNDVVKDAYGNVISYDSNSYRHFDSTRDHIYNVPDMYVGSAHKESQKMMLLNINDPKNVRFFSETITLPPAVRRVNLEILSNAGDNIMKSKQQGVRMSKYPLQVQMTSNSITIRNEGISIPIGPWNKDPSVRMLPEAIFGDLYFSQSYGDDIKNLTSARNGLGAKLTSIFSNYFKVTVASPSQGLKYEQVWEKNMTIKNPYTVSPYNGESYVEISYSLDFTRFGYTQYPEEALYLFAKDAADAGFAGKFCVKFNGIILNVKDVEEYAKLIYGPNLPNHIVHYEWPEGTPLVTKKGRKISSDDRIIPIVEIIYLDTPDKKQMFAFTNGLINAEGGIHVDNGYEAISNKVLSIINNVSEKKKAKEEAGKKLPKITARDIQNHISIIITCRVYKPRFESQSKNKLTGYSVDGRDYTKIKIDLPEEVTKMLDKWDVLPRLYNELQAKMFNALKSTDGKRGNRHKVEKEDPANFKGRKDCLNRTVLILVEGKSAKGWATTFIAQIPEGRNYWGVYPLRGKVLNSLNASFEQHFKNPEFIDIKTSLNLKEGVDYTIYENFLTLNYGKLAIATDADNDGKHIMGLIILFLAHRFPSLLYIPGFLNYIRTPIVRAKKGKEKVKFYSLDEYEEWCRATPDYMKWTTKYLKGLASSEPKHIKDDFSTLRMVNIIPDSKLFENLKLAFDKSLSNDRKFWMTAYQKIQGLKIENIPQLSISDFINYEFIDFSLVNVARSIPAIDGLKESVRKCIWASLEKWGASAGKKKSKEFKISQLVGYIADKTGYHYGPSSLEGAIYHHNKRWAGTNNMSLFSPKAILGTRNEEGDDGGQTRYTFTKPSAWIRDMFNPIDDNLYVYNIDEGQQCEPELMYPIVPLSLINGELGIGTGYSTFIPGHNPAMVCEWLINRLMGKPVPLVYPWYNGFKGIISVEYRLIKEKKEKKKNEYDDIFSTKLDLDGVDDIGADFFNSTNVPKTPIDKTKTHEVFNAPLPELVSTAIFEHPEITSEQELINNAMRHNEELSKKPRKPTMVVVGVFNVLPNGNVEITEIPITISFLKYQDFLKKLVEQKKLKDFHNLCKENVCHFILMGLNFKPTIKSLRLKKCFGLTNMVLLQPNGRPIKYYSSQDILEHFYQWRLPIYVKRKEFILNQKMEKIAYLKNKMKFIMAVIHCKENGYQEGININIMNIKKEEIYRQMTLLQINNPPETLKSVASSRYSLEACQKMYNEIIEMEKEYNEIYNTPHQKMWVDDLNNFLDVYYKHFGYDVNAGRYNGNLFQLKMEEEMEKEEKEKEKAAKEAANFFDDSSSSSTKPTGKRGRKKVVVDNATVFAPAPHATVFNLFETF